MTPSEDSDERFWEEVHSEEDRYVDSDDNRRQDHVTQVRQSIRSKMTNPEAKKDSVDDAPISIKRTLELPTEDETESKRAETEVY